MQKTAAPPVVDAVKQAVVCTDGAGQQLGGQVSDWVAALLVVALQEKAHGRKRMVDRATHGRGVSCGGQPQIQPVGLLELPHVVQQAGQRGEARQPYLPQCRGCIFRRFPAVCLRGLLATVVRDMCKIFHTSPPNDFRIASGVSDKQDNYAQLVGNGRNPWKLRAVFQKDPADYITWRNDSIKLPVCQQKIFRCKMKWTLSANLDRQDAVGVVLYSRRFRSHEGKRGLKCCQLEWSRQTPPRGLLALGAVVV